MFVKDGAAASAAKKALGCLLSRHQHRKAAGLLVRPMVALPLARSPVIQLTRNGQVEEIFEDSEFIRARRLHGDALRKSLSRRGPHRMELPLLRTNSTGACAMDGNPRTCLACALCR